jgi:hypothetical protein
VQQQQPALAFRWASTARTEHAPHFGDLSFQPGALCLESFEGCGEYFLHEVHHAHRMPVGFVSSSIVEMDLR